MATASSTSCRPTGERGSSRGSASPAPAAQWITDYNGRAGALVSPTPGRLRPSRAVSGRLRPSQAVSRRPADLRPDT
eukprot:7381366-Prymnesium_polylepis.1